VSATTDRHISASDWLVIIGLALTVAGGGFLYLSDRITAVDEFHTAHRVRVWDKLEELRKEVSGLSNDVARLDGKADAILSAITSNQKGKPDD
jgi:hypothetical protein